LWIQKKQDVAQSNDKDCFDQTLANRMPHPELLAEIALSSTNVAINELASVVCMDPIQEKK
jgi:hypothetical protein